MEHAAVPASCVAQEAAVSGASPMAAASGAAFSGGVVQEVPNSKDSEDASATEKLAIVAAEGACRSCCKCHFQKSKLKAANKILQRKVQRRNISVEKQRALVKQLHSKLLEHLFKKEKSSRYSSITGGLTLACRRCISNVGSNGVGLLLGFDCSGQSIRNWEVMRSINRSIHQSIIYIDQFLSTSEFR